jgi:hypothetical protein
MSSSLGHPLQHPEDVASKEALQAADGLAHGLAFARFARDVGDRLRVGLAPADDDRVQGAVELTVAAAVEAVADALPLCASALLLNPPTCSLAEPRPATRYR